MPQGGVSVVGYDTTPFILVRTALAKQGAEESENENRE